MSNPTLRGLAAWTAEDEPQISAYLQLAAVTGLAVSDLGARIYIHYGRGGGRYAVIRNTGITVDTILTMIRFGIPAEVILRAEPKLEWDDLAACCWEAANTDYQLHARKAVDNE